MRESLPKERDGEGLEITRGDPEVIGSQELGKVGHARLTRRRGSSQLAGGVL